MEDETFEEAVQTMMSASATPEDRVMAARHMGASDQDGCFNALHDLCRDDDVDPTLSRAAAKSLQRVGEATGRSDEIDVEALTAAAREEFEPA